jgi:hypothetical protein
MASFMGPAYIRRLRGSQGTVPKQLKCRAPNRPNGPTQTAQTEPKMPTTTNRRRAYIRRSQAIQWSSRRRSYQASTSPLKTR